MRHPYHPQSPAEAPGPSAPQGRGAGPRGPSSARLEAVVCEAVFRYQLQQLLVDPSPPLRYYLTLRGHDPDDTLLSRLRDLTPRVHPLSHCRVTAREGVRDRATAARGVILQVARLTWVHAAAVDVTGGYYLTHRHAAGLRYRVEPQGDAWAVTTVHLLWRA